MMIQLFNLFLLFFQGCLKLSSDFAGANVYVEQHRTLKLLHGRSNSAAGSSSSSQLLLRPDGKRHCFESHAGQVALFMESSAGGGLDPLRRETAAFDYDLQLLDPDRDESGQSHLNHQSNDPWQGETLANPLSSSSSSSRQYPAHLLSLLQFPYQQQQQWRN